VKTTGARGRLAESDRSWSLPLPRWATWVLVIAYIVGLVLLKPFGAPWLIYFVTPAVLFGVGGFWDRYLWHLWNRWTAFGLVAGFAAVGLAWVVLGGGATTRFYGDCPGPPGGGACPAWTVTHWGTIAIGVAVGAACGVALATTLWVGSQHRREH